MPRKPKRPCRYQGCPNLTEDKSGYCEQHRKQAEQSYNRYARNPNAKKMYGHEWEKIRNRYIQLHPLCEDCLENGIATEAKEVHHVLPISFGGTHAEDNLRALCRSCHNKRHIALGDRKVGERV